MEGRSTPQTKQSRPFVTRWSTIGFGVTAIAADTIARMLVDPKTQTLGTGMRGVIASFTIAVFLLATMVAWVNGIILARRSGSLFWLMVALLPEVGAIACALWAPTKPPPSQAAGS